MKGKYLDDQWFGGLKPKRKRYFVSDAIPGYYGVVQPTGKKSLMFIKREPITTLPDGGKVPGKLIKIFLGHYPAKSIEECREDAKKYLKAYEKKENLKDLKKNEDEARQATQAETVAVIGKTWLIRDQADKRGFKDVERFFNNKLVPAWGNRPISTITKKDCLAFVDKYADETSQVRSNRIFTYIHRMLSWCVERDILKFNPMLGAKKLTTDNSRERVLTDHELVEVWRASDFLDGDPRRPNQPLKSNQYGQAGPIWGPIIKLLILLGARREEIGGLRWSEVNLKEGVLVLPGNRTKRLPKDKDKPRMIYLSERAKEILKNTPRRLGRDFVFGATGTSPVCGWEKAKTRLEKHIAKARAEAGITEAMPDWWIHDLRRTLATGFQRLGIRLEVTENVLGHLSGSRSGVVKVYQRYNFEDESRDAVELWASRIDDFLAGRFEKKQKKQA